MIDFFEFSNEMLCIANREGYFTRVNAAWTQTLGWTSEEITSRQYLDFVHPDDHESTLREAAHLQSGGETSWFENRYLCKDGSYRWLGWKCKAVPHSPLLVASARDITEQKQQSQALAESEARFRLLAAHAPIGIAQSDAEGNTFYVNEKWCEMAGANLEQAKGGAWRKLIHPDDLAPAIAHWRRYVERGEDMPPFEFRFLHRDGHVRWSSSSVALLKDASGKVVTQIGTLVDITDQKEVELRYRGIYERAPIGIALIDSHTGRFLHINPSYERIIGRTEAEMLQLTFQEISHPDDLPADLENMSKLRAGVMQHFQMEKRLFRGDGALIWTSLTVVPMWRTDEPATFHLAMVEDITQRKTSADALRESEERFRAFMNNTPALAWAKDEAGRYVYLNRACEQALRSRQNPIWGHTDHEIFPAHIADTLRNNDLQVLQSGEPLQTLELTQFDADEAAHWLITKFLFHDGQGRRCIGGMAIDFTEAKKTEESLRSNTALLGNLIEVQEQERRILCQEFHDGLMQYAFGAVMSLSAFRDKHPGTEAAAVMDHAIAALRTGIDDGRRAIRGIRPAVLDDFGLVAAIEDLVDQQANTGILVTFKHDSEPGPLTSELESAIYRIVQEALNNARKYSGTDVIRISLNRSGNDLLLEVIDFGCGFDVAAARQRGFGLLGMTERVRLLGGECRIESQRDSGTRISARVPIQPAGQNQ